MDNRKHSCKKEGRQGKPCALCQEREAVKKKIEEHRKLMAVTIRWDEVSVLL